MTQQGRVVKRRVPVFFMNKHRNIPWAVWAAIAATVAFLIAAGFGSKWPVALLIAAVVFIVVVRWHPHHWYKGMCEICLASAGATMELPNIADYLRENGWMKAGQPAPGAAPAPGSPSVLIWAGLAMFFALLHYLQPLMRRYEVEEPVEELAEQLKKLEQHGETDPLSDRRVAGKVIGTRESLEQDVQDLKQDLEWKCRSLYAINYLEQRPAEAVKWQNAGNEISEWLSPPQNLPPANQSAP